MRPIAGSIVALVTPMLEDGSIDYAGLRKLIDWHIAEGTNCLGVVGTTGESPTVSIEENCEVIRVSVEHAKGRIPIMAGTGSNSTAQTLRLSRAVDRLGVVAFLIVTPYYNKPTQEGMRRHFSAVADAVTRPLILYNVPGRTGVDLKPDTVIKLAGHPNIKGIKEATGELNRVQVLRDACGPGFSLLSGDDATCCEFMLQGGNGVISVTANVAAAGMRRLCDAARARKRADAERIDSTLQPLHRDLFCESNPIPVKWAVQQMGLIGPGIRLPLTSLAPQFHAVVLDAMTAAGVRVAVA